MQLIKLKLRIKKTYYKYPKNDQYDEIDVSFKVWSSCSSIWRVIWGSTIDKHVKNVYYIM